MVVPKHFTVDENFHKNIDGTISRLPNGTEAGSDGIYYQILASLRFASTEERVTRSSKQMKCGWYHLFRGHFFIYFHLYLIKKQVVRARRTVHITAVPTIFLARPEALTLW